MWMSGAQMYPQTRICHCDTEVTARFDLQIHSMISWGTTNYLTLTFTQIVFLRVEHVCNMSIYRLLHVTLCSCKLDSDVTSVGLCVVQNRADSGWKEVLLVMLPVGPNYSYIPLLPPVTNRLLLQQLWSYDNKLVFGWVFFCLLLPMVFEDLVQGGKFLGALFLVHIHASVCN